MNIAEIEADTAYLAERPERERPTAEDARGSYVRPVRAVCTCKADTVNDPNHNCRIHPPF